MVRRAAEEVGRTEDLGNKSVQHNVYIHSAHSFDSWLKFRKAGAGWEGRRESEEGRGMYMRSMVMEA
jgi:hypothetical protein